MRRPVRADQPRLRVDIEPESRRIGPGVAARDQTAQDRLARPRKVALRSGAVDDPADPEGLLHVGAARAVRHGDAVAFPDIAARLAADDGQLSPRDHRVDPRRHLRREAVAVNVPPRPQVAKEARALDVVRRQPQALCERPQLVDRRAPA